MFFSKRKRKTVDTTYKADFRRLSHILLKFKNSAFKKLLRKGHLRPHIYYGFFILQLFSIMTDSIFMIV